MGCLFGISEIKYLSLEGWLPFLFSCKLIRCLMDPKEGKYKLSKLYKVLWLRYMQRIACHFAIPDVVSRLRPSASPGNLCWEMQHLGTHPDLQSQNLHFKIIRWFIWTLNLRNTSITCQAIQLKAGEIAKSLWKEERNFKTTRSWCDQSIHHAGLSFRCQTWISETSGKKKEKKEATFAEFEQQLLNFLCHVNGGKIETISWLNKKC